MTLSDEVRAAFRDAEVRLALRICEERERAARREICDRLIALCDSATVKLDVVNKTRRRERAEARLMRVANMEGW